MSANTLRVCTNPFHFIDHHGCPAGTAHREFIPGRGGQPFRATAYIGARLAPNPTVEREAPPEPPPVKGSKPGSHVGKFQKARHHIRYVFDRDPIEVTDTLYNRRLVSEQVLLAADEATAKTCGAKFEDPEKARERWRTEQGCTAEPLWKGDTPVAPDATPATDDEAKAASAQEDTPSEANTKTTARKR